MLKKVVVCIRRDIFNHIQQPIRLHGGGKRYQQHHRGYRRSFGLQLDNRTGSLLTSISLRQYSCGMVGQLYPFRGHSELLEIYHRIYGKAIRAL